MHCIIVTPYEFTLQFELSSNNYSKYYIAVAAIIYTYKMYLVKRDTTVQKVIRFN